jgi:uncharacterized protein (DUF433 family)
MRARVYLIVWGAVMMGAATVVLVINQDASTELLGGIAFISGVAVIVNAILDLTGNGTSKEDLHDRRA